MFFHQFRIETIMAGRYRRVSCKHGRLSDIAKCVIERLAIFVHLLTNRFQRSERAVTFVQMKDSRSDAERTKRPYPANSKDQLLANSSPLVTTI